MNRCIISGGAGFIGCAATERFYNLGYDVIVLDNLSRKGSEINLKWLKENCKNIKFYKVDIRNRSAVEKVFKANKPEEIEVVLHLAAQVAVTYSIENPQLDFETNVIGSFNLLEVIRKLKINPVIIYSSTNKVYGDLSSAKIIEKKNKYVLKTPANGINEEFKLDFLSPYGCSKGIADQYFLDYARTYNIRTVSLRQSCIYGERQFGIEDQGWLAWFVIAFALNKEIKIYGNGKQTRDVLHIFDLMDAFELVIKNIKTTSGKAYNIGGGLDNSISLLELISILKKKTNTKVKISYHPWRLGDQKIYISNITKAFKDFNWKPKIEFHDGIDRLINWVYNNKSTIKKVLL